MSLKTPRALKAAVLGALAVLLAAQTALPPGAEARARASLEDKVKTAFLYKFTKYIQWPGGEPAEDFRIAVLGESGIAEPLRELARETPAEGRKIRTELLGSVEDIGRCHILFISASERARLPEILKKTEGRNILTVGESRGLAERGVVLNFVVVDGRLRFEINRRAADRAGLQISSELLKLAILVEGGADNVQP